MLVHDLQRLALQVARQVVDVDLRAQMVVPIPVNLGLNSKVVNLLLASRVQVLFLLVGEAEPYGLVVVGLGFQLLTERVEDGVLERRLNGCRSASSQLYRLLDQHFQLGNVGLHFLEIEVLADLVDGWRVDQDSFDVFLVKLDPGRDVDFGDRLAGVHLRRI